MAATAATDATRVQVSYNPNFKIEKEGGSSITLLVIGILFVAGGVTVGVLGLKEILPLGETGSKACIAGGSAIGVSFLVTGYFATTISNYRKGLPYATKHNKEYKSYAWQICGDIHSGKTYTEPYAPRVLKGMKYQEIATYQVTQENALKSRDDTKKFLEKCESYSLCVVISQSLPDLHGVTTLKILTPIKV